ncbi:MAG: tetratricopeptide repeat protein, partial [Desulfomicrobium sp.]|nr:tetratricopeptide repeat protein [Desulfomicrobium sp.]
GCAQQIAPSPATTAPVKAPASAEAQAIYSYLAYRELLQENKSDKAAQALEQAIALKPAPELYLELGNLHWRASRFSDALLVLNQGLTTYPDSEALLSTLAKTYAAQGRFDDAVLVLDDYSKKHPEIIDLAHEAALYRLEQGRFGDAVDRLNAIPAKDADQTTNFLLGKGYFGLELYDKAIAAYLQAVATDPEYYNAWIELGLTYEVQKNYIDAERVFSRLVDLGIANQQILFHLVELNLKLNNPDQALSYVQQAADNPALALEAANLLLNRNFYDHAADILDPMALENPIPLDAHFFLAVLEYEGRDNPEKALTYLESIPEGHHHYERSLIFRIHLLYRKDDKSGAKALCASAMKIFPKQPEFTIIMAEMNEYDGEYQQALDLLLKATATWPDNTTILYRLGMVYDRMEHRDQAMLVMDKIISKDSEHADALNYLGYSLAEQGRDLERAKLLIESALKVKPDNGYFVDSLAWVYFKQGKNRLAWQEIKRAVQLVDSDPVIWEHYGDIARALKLFSEARKGYEKALGLEGDNVEDVRTKLNSIGRAQ